MGLLQAYNYAISTFDGISVSFALSGWMNVSFFSLARNNTSDGAYSLADSFEVKVSYHTCVLPYRIEVEEVSET